MNVPHLAGSLWVCDKQNQNECLDVQCHILFQKNVKKKPPTLMKSMAVACVCTYICMRPLIMHMSGAYSSCDSYACTCAVV